MTVGELIDSGLVLYNQYGFEAHIEHYSVEKIRQSLQLQELYRKAEWYENITDPVLAVCVRKDKMDDVSNVRLVHIIGRKEGAPHPFLCINGGEYGRAIPVTESLTVTEAIKLLGQEEG